MRGRARIDANHKDVVQALRKAGALVQSLAAIGRGVPDLLCAHRGRLFLVEVKDGDKIPSKRKLTDDEAEWHATWATRAPVYVVESAEEALAVMGGRA